MTAVNDNHSGQNFSYYDLVSIGEILIDFTARPKRSPAKLNGASIISEIPELYEANPGGAPANVACTAQAYGLSTAFIGAVGSDHFGSVLKETLSGNKIDISAMQTVDSAFTTLAFVSIDSQANRTFSFSRKPGADTFLSLGEKQGDVLSRCRVLHYGSLSLSHEPARNSTCSAVKQVQRNGGLVSFDPNLRLSLWESKESLLDQVNWGFNHCDILKFSEEDLFQIDSRAPEEVIGDLFRSTQISLVLLSAGADGSKAYWLDEKANLQCIAAPSDRSIVAVDTTGAGDIFTGAFISKLVPLLDVGADLENFREIRKNFIEWMGNPKELGNILLFANQIAGMSTLSPGGIPSIPKLSDWKDKYSNKSSFVESDPLRIRSIGKIFAAKSAPSNNESI